VKCWDVLFVGHNQFGGSKVGLANIVINNDVGYCLLVFIIYVIFQK